MSLFKKAAGVLVVFLMSALSVAQPFGRGPGVGNRAGSDEDFAKDRELFHFLLDHRESIRRSVVNTDDGVETLTESDNPLIAASLKEHVHRMYQRVKHGPPIHLRDPLFQELFDHSDKIDLSLEETDRGIRARESSLDPRVVKLIQEHARVVTLFLDNGRAEVLKDHKVP